jgi:hypothetical protein
MSNNSMISVPSLEFDPRNRYNSQGDGKGQFYYVNGTKFKLYEEGGSCAGMYMTWKD